MRKFLFCLVAYILIVIQPSFGQSHVVTEMRNALTEVAGSFLDNPKHHSNTIKIYNLTSQCSSVLEEMYRQVPSSADSDFYKILNMKKIVKCLDFVTANIAGYTRGGIDAAEWESTFHPIMTGFGWTWKLTHSTSDVVFYEYSKDGFRMVLAKNIRPKKDGEDYNANSFSCYAWQPVYKEHYPFISRIVFGGNYQFVEYGDDEQQFKKITKVSSKRGINF